MGFGKICVVLGAIFAVAACSKDSTTSPTPAADASVDAGAPNADAGADAGLPQSIPLAFIYQDVGLFDGGVSPIRIKAGITSNGVTIDSLTNGGVLAFQIPFTGYGFGDPVVSRLPNGRFALTSWGGPTDGGTLVTNNLMYHEANCPQVDASAIRLVTASNDAGCTAVSNMGGAKTSQIFANGSDTFLFHHVSGETYLMHIGDATRSGANLSTVCLRTTPPTTISQLAWGESMKIHDKDAGYLWSDSAIARRQDGTWALFTKGYPADAGCTANSVCELCARGIYRSTSTDLRNWTAPTQVVTQASVPEATNTADGKVWLYWDDFSQVCATQNQQLSSRAPNAAAYELADGGFSNKMYVVYAEEPFETNTSLHYATNANPINLPSLDASAAYTACF